MDKKKLESILYAKKYNPDEEALFNFNMLTGRSIYSMLSEYDIYQLYQIATDMKLSANLAEKIKRMNAILRPKGFERFGNGTNRIVYRSVCDNSILLKVAIDKVGLGDALKEMENQYKLAPFVTKIFDVHPSGIVASVERVIPIKSHKVLSLLSEDFYNLITKVFVGRFVMEDIGDEYFMNWGIREGFGLVLLDFPYLYELDGNKLICRAKSKLNPNIPCLGEIDYDIGFNHLVCKRCGMEYRAKDMAKLINERGIEMVRSNNIIPVVARVVRGNTIICESKQESNIISKENHATIHKEKTSKKLTIPSMREQLKKEFVPLVRKHTNHSKVNSKIETPVPPTGYNISKNDNTDNQRIADKVKKFIKEDFNSNITNTEAKNKDIERDKSYTVINKINISDQYANNIKHTDFNGAVVNENIIDNEEIKEAIVEPNDEESTNITFVSIDEKRKDDNMELLDERNIAIENFNKEIDRTIESYLKYFQEEYPDKTYDDFKKEIVKLAEVDYENYPENDILKKEGKDPIEFGKQYILNYLENNKLKDSFLDNEYFDDKSNHIEKIKSKKYSSKIDNF